MINLSIQIYLENLFFQFQKRNFTRLERNKKIQLFDKEINLAIFTIE